MTQLEKFQAMESMELIQEKLKRLKNLQKVMSDIQGCDVAKGAERAKLTRFASQLNDELTNINLIEKVIKEKDF